MARSSGLGAIQPANNRNQGSSGLADQDWQFVRFFAKTSNNQSRAANHEHFPGDPGTHRRTVRATPVLPSRRPVLRNVHQPAAVLTSLSQTVKAVHELKEFPSCWPLANLRLLHVQTVLCARDHLATPGCGIPEGHRKDDLPAPWVSGSLRQSSFVGHRAAAKRLRSGG